MSFTDNHLIQNHYHMEPSLSLVTEAERYQLLLLQDSPTLPEADVQNQRTDTTIDNRLSLQALSTPIKTEAQKTGIDTHVDNRSLLRWLRETIVEQIANSLRTEPSRIPLDNSFHSLGLDSLKAIEIMATLGDIFGISFSPTLLFEYPTIAELTEHLVQVHGPKLKEYMPAKGEQSKLSATASEKQPVGTSSSAKVCQRKVEQVNDFVREDDIAVIGMGCRFPQAPDLESFWELLREGKDAVSEVPTDRWDWHTYYDDNPEAANKTYSRWGGFIDGVDQFDPMFFNISPREAKLIDPQQRIFLEVAWETLEHAGYSAERLAQTEVGVFVGCSNNGYYQRIAPALTPLDHAAGIGNQNAIIANRVSFFLNLRGPSILVDTMCSSSLVTLHMACQSLREGECTVALAGGVNILLSPEYYIAMSRMKAHSPDGRCKTFDRRANGIVLGEGAGAVLLKPLGRALEDGDKVYAVIKGSAVNHGGNTNGLTAPNPRSQAEVICRALEVAGVSADSISYVEAHGTGTSLGDPIEIEGLTKAFRKYTNRKQFCAIGSVKTNIGHLEPAAGMAQLLKVILAMQHRQLPPSLHLEKPNEFIPFAETPFKVNTSLCPWDSEGWRRAGISSFGMGGTNAHVIIEEAPVLELVHSDIERPVHLLTLSAKTETALRSLACRYQAFLDSTPGVSLADVCFSANTGRSHFAHRTAVIAESTVQLQGALGAFVAGNKSVGLVSGHLEGRTRPQIAFLFTGQGSQFVGMGHQLYETQPTFRKTLERCDELLRPYLEVPLLSVLYPASDRSHLLHSTAYTQPALFALEYGLAELWQSWGIVPDAIMGHSIGEYVAACVAGVFSLEEGLKLAAERGRLMQALSSDGMMAVVLTDKERVATAVAPHTEKVAIAAVNGPKNIVISGQREAVQAVIDQLQSEGVAVEPLNVSHAFHSPLMEPMLDAFEQTARQVKFKAPHIPLISNVTGQIFKPGEIPDAKYWCRHIRETVKFAAGMNVLAEEGYEIFLEIGPDATLLSMGKRCLPKGKSSWLPSLKQRKDDWQALLESLSRLYLLGADLDWSGFDRDYSRSRLSLPTYPFERQRYWVDTTSAMDDQKLAVEASSLQVEPTPNTNRRDEILSTLRIRMANLLQADPSAIEVDAPFTEMGADSLVLIEAVRAIENAFGIKVTIRQLFEELATTNALATYIDQTLPPAFALENSSPPKFEPVVPSEQTTRSVGGNAPKQASQNQTPDIEDAKVMAEVGLERIMAQQLEVVSEQLQVVSKVISQQLNVLSNSRLSPERSLPLKTQLSDLANRSIPSADAPFQNTSANAEPRKTAAELCVPFQPIKPGAQKNLDPRQQQHLEALITRYTKRTQESKRRKQTYHPVLADSRAVAGFRLSIKEMLYPIIGDRAQGSRLVDVDGNEYVDITMGFGVLLFGHAAPFITEALEEQIKLGIKFGSQSNLAGEVADLICELTGMERVTFCNSGTEAVMTALRLARTATGRSKIALFAGSYHGHFDGVLASGSNSQISAVPIAPGVSQHAVEDVLVLDYENPNSIDILQAHAHELAAVLVEPVQSRRPDLQPKEFLQQLRQWTQATGTALIFDEVLTGFRIHPGGAQAWFGIEADIATYGKVVGGGMPIGVVAGKATYMNGIDGGLWNYGDASYPQAEQTFFAGTFNKHPLAMAVARAVLKHLQRQGSALQQQLNQRTSQLAETLNTYFKAEDVPIRIVHFGSLFRFTFSGNLDLLFYHLLEKGVYIWEGRNCFLSTAHTDEDIAYVIQAVKDSVEELREGGFLPERSVKPPEDENGSGGKSGSLTKPSPATDAVPVSASLEMQLVSEEEAKQANKVPLSEAQKQLWFLTLIGDDGSLAYNISTSLLLRGSFHLVAMRQAVQKIVNRHEALRTTISSQGDFQQILPSLKVNVSLIDFSGVDTAERESKVAEWFKKESREPFDLSQGSLFRVQILKLEEQLHLLVLTAHHIVVDGLSMGVILQELGALYSAECQGVICQLAPPMQFREYIDWQKQQSQTEEMAAHESYWLKQFANSIPVLDLPTDRPRPPIKSYRGSRQTMQLDASLCRDIKRVSREKACTLFMTLLSVYTALLHRLTSQDDLVVGITVAGRSLEGSEGLVGYCAHLLPVRSCVTETPTFSEYLTTIRHILLQGYEHQDYPFARLINKLLMPRDASRSPIITATFNLDRPVAVPKMFELETDLISQPLSFADYDINLNVTDVDGQLVFDCDYNTDLFDAATIKRMLGHFQTLLTAIVANPHQHLKELALLTATEQHQLLVEWNDTFAEYPFDKCVHQLFEAQVEQTPDAVAVVFENQQLTYAQLNAQANRLAHFLVEQGVDPDTTVTLLVERSIDFLSAMMAVFKAGGAYLPIDPHHPAQRLCQVLQQSQTSLVLAASKFDSVVSQALRDLPSGKRPQVLVIEELLEQQQSEENLPVCCTPSNLAYVIYTSGSTGVPKGAMVEHRGMLNHLYAKIWDLKLTDADTVAQTARQSFDISVWQFLAALLVGGRVHIFNDEAAVDPTQLLEQVKGQGISILEIVPSLLRMMLEQITLSGANRPNLSALRWLLLTGEALPPQLCRQWLEYYPGIPMLNAYGPTECSDDVTHYPIYQPPAPEVLNIPIGRPVANTQLYLLDSQLQPVPIGVSGELYVGGMGVGRGYLNNAERTSEVFIADIFAQKPGARLYKTGDKARYLSDGNIEFLGRLDHQVKIRGFRLELGEIEAALAQHPEVRETVVIAWEDQPDDKRLVAYVVPNQEVETQHFLSLLRRFLKEKLPDYMIPSAFVMLEALPLTPNGKVDRRALPAPDTSQTSLEQGFVPPHTATEETLAAIWAEVLGVERVGIHDNFFELGGNSLLATQVISRLREAFHVELPLRSLFEEPTVAYLSESIETSRWAAQELPVHPSAVTMNTREEGEI
jgi:glutamate-1-semialdehyde-2,1-aminomutase/malonyl CoA-acyl carrier protein transacylase